MSDEDLFVKIDTTEEVKKRVQEFLGEKDRIRNSILSDNVPQVPVSIDCRKCDYLEQCHPGYAKINSIFYLPRLSHSYNRLVSCKILSKRSLINETTWSSGGAESLFFARKAFH